MKKADVKKLAVTGILVGITLFLGLTPFGIIPIGPANMSFLAVPIVIGTIICGLPTGLLLGGIFGLTSLWKAFSAPSALVVPLMGESPVLVIVMSLVPRLLIPIVIWFVYKGVTKKGTLSKTGTGLAAAAGALTNTVFYLGMMLLFYVLCGIDSEAVLVIIGGVGALNGSLEAVGAVIVSIPVVMALRKTKGDGR